MNEPTVEVPLSELLALRDHYNNNPGYRPRVCVALIDRIPPWEPPEEWVDALTKAGAIGPYHILTALHDAGALRDE